MLRLEIAAKARLTRRQTILAAAGAAAALTAVLLLLSALTLLLGQLLVSLAGWPPLVAGGLSALLIGLIAAGGGVFIIRNAATAIGKEGVAPKETIASLRSTAATLADQPLQPPTAAPLSSTSPSNPIDTMNTPKQFRRAMHDTAETIQDQTRRAGRAVRETADTISSKFDPGAFFANVMTWVDDFMHPNNRALASRALAAASVLPRRHPLPAALIGAGAAWMLYRKMHPEQTAQEAVEDFSATTSSACRDFVDQSSSAVKKGYRAATQGAEAAARAGRDVRDAFNEASGRWADSGRAAAATLRQATTDATARAREVYDDAREYVSETSDSMAETAKQLRKDAEAGIKKAKEFAREEPALTIAGGIALAIGAALLVKSSRR
jgi:ElaB/YqjD/DUF883 family membrane-anchored ribosome-binding protein